ncbi:hypothetical protein KC360_g7654 [Hortaea werneckii]|nr:hypothetical protein KC325_g7633 [Hortaea werneckii]KAI6988013.1 hypothetical protein KC359_g7986 [Hortaea werneckii]KAI7141893.1 hypothetical protein KC344_g7645 [Hortaea werneckii]KAI7169171.1 hypothetical protein KC360_g7654 [Hortaea werneckii]
MRLLKTGPYPPGKNQLQLIQVWGEDVPPFAVLSHTWSGDPDDEVLFADIKNGTAATKHAYGKIQDAIKAAVLDGYGYLWIDTCCIDKTSSVELSEAINSMYSYYATAQKCYAFLADVDSSLEKDRVCFSQARWWLRGWTLQELLAPEYVEFFSSDWTSLGTKNELCREIAQITGIDSEYLNGSVPVQDASIAQRMSWASKRRTTRDEDQAYSLIGLFDVNMTMLYGEGGRRAFLRLQEEIMRINEDQTIFAWVKEAQNQDAREKYHGLLADSPADFRSTGATVAYTVQSDQSLSFMTARGLRLTLPMTKRNDGVFVAALQCPVPERGFNDWLAVYLVKLDIGSEQYARVFSHQLASISRPGQSREIYVRQSFPQYATRTLYPLHLFHIRSLSLSTEYPELAEYQLEEVLHMGEERVIRQPQPQPWSRVPLRFKMNKKAHSLAAAIVIRRVYDDESFIMMLGTSSEFEVGFDVCENPKDENMDAHCLQCHFDPQPAGITMKLLHHSVRVKVEERVFDGMKLYFLDFELQALAIESTLAKILQDAVGSLAQPSSPQNKASLAATGGKLKQSLKTIAKRKF